MSEDPPQHSPGMLYCTYCDQGYAARMLVLFDSLCRVGGEFALHVLCFDDATERAVKAEGDPRLVALPLSELLEIDADFAAVRPTRSKVEFYFTATPVFLRYCLGLVREGAWVTYLDADLWFFSSPDPVFRQQERFSAAIVPHRFPSRLKHLETFGLYNVAWVSFRRDQDGLSLADWWRSRCLEWCRDVPDQGRFADQGYLNEFPRFAGVVVLEGAGVDAAPWNLDGLTLSAKNGVPMLSGEKLVFFHFQGVRELFPGWFEPGLNTYATDLTPALRRLVYQPYLDALGERQEMLIPLGIVPSLGYRRLSNSGAIWERCWQSLMQVMLPHYKRISGQLVKAIARRDALTGSP